ncbi:MAG: PAS domain S-box protein [Nitrospirae bacterium]|nr:PAS domain S-box protein [Nitrospirota bacterium]
MSLLTLRSKIIVIILSLLFISAGVWIYKSQEHHYKTEAQERLMFIAKLKADQIAYWRDQRLSEAFVIQESPFFMSGLSSFLINRSDQDKRFILTRFASLQRYSGYSDVLLIDAKGNVQLSLTGRVNNAQAYAKVVSSAFEKNAAMLTDLHICPDFQEPHISTIVPIFSTMGKEKQKAGALIFISSAAQHLYPLIDKSVAGELSLETVLVRKDGEHVLYLSDLRYRHDTALKLRIPLTKTDTPSVIAVMGKQGVFEGRDYRGVNVISAILPVEGSNWFVVSKQDKSEIFAGWRFHAMLILGLIASVAGMLVALGMFIIKREEKNNFRARYKSESALRQSIERQSITLKSIGDAVIATDAQGRVELLNPVAEELTGWSNEEAKGRPLELVFKIINEYTRHQVENPVARVLREGTVVGLANHTLLISKDGVERPIADSGAPIKNDEGAITGVVLVFRDQTAERKAEKEILDQKKKLETILEAANLGTWVWDIGTGRTEYNDLWIRMLGFNPKEIKPEATSFTELLHPDDKPKLAEIMKEMREGRLTSFEHEIRMRTKDGVWKWFMDAGRVIDFDQFGSPLLAMGIHQDINERKKMDASIKESEERFRAIVVGAPDAIFIQTDRKFAYVNEEALKLFGAEDASQIIGKSVFDRFHPDFHELVKARIKMLNEDRKPVTKSIEQIYLRLDGSEVWVETSAHPIVYKGKKGALVFVRDITQRKALENQLMQAQKMESVGRLAGGVAHDFNNMLGVIIGYSEIALSKMAPDNPLRTALQEIHKTANRSADLTKQLLAFARKQIISPKVIDLNKTIEGMLKMLQRLIGEDIELSWLPGVDLNKVKINPAQVEQILANLCVNSRDAISGVGKVIIETGNVVFDDEFCSLNADFIPGEYVQLVVSDTGCGMDKETLKSAFEPFFTTKDVGKGTGLGLATVYGIVQQNRGFIKIYSELNHGTTIKIFFAKNAEDDAESVASSELEPQHGKGEIVLIVEDEPSILVMAKVMLETLGYKVLTANRPNDAMKIAAEHSGKIDLLITDVIMPEMNGKDLAARMLGLYPNLKQLFMSGYTADVIAQHGILDEGVNFVQKPFSVRELAAKVREVLN